MYSQIINYMKVYKYVCIQNRHIKAYVLFFFKDSIAKLAVPLYVDVLAIKTQWLARGSHELIT